MSEFRTHLLPLTELEKSNTTKLLKTHVELNHGQFSRELGICAVRDRWGQIPGQKQYFPAIMLFSTILLEENYPQECSVRISNAKFQLVKRLRPHKDIPIESIRVVDSRFSSRCSMNATGWMQLKVLNPDDPQGNPIMSKEGYNRLLIRTQEGLDPGAWSNLPAVQVHPDYINDPNSKELMVMVFNSLLLTRGGRVNINGELSPKPDGLVFRRDHHLIPARFFTLGRLFERVIGRTVDEEIED